MSENNQGEKGLFEILEEKSLSADPQSNSKSYTHEFSQVSSKSYDDERVNDFLIQDMFLDHFFP